MIHLILFYELPLGLQNVILLSGMIVTFRTPGWCNQLRYTFCLFLGMTNVIISGNIHNLPRTKFQNYYKGKL